MAEILARVESARASAAASPPINCEAYEGRSSMTQLAQRDLHARCDPVLWTVFDVITAASQLFNSTGLRDQSLKGAGTHQYIGRKDQCATMRLLPKLLAPLLQRPVETVCEVGFVRRRALHRSAPAYTQLPLHAHFLRVRIFLHDGASRSLLARISLASRDLAAHTGTCTWQNAGHSAAIWLEGTSVRHLHSFDIMDHSYSAAQVALLQRLYPGRLTMHRGNSFATLRQYANAVHARSSARGSSHGEGRAIRDDVHVPISNASAPSLCDIWVRLALSSLCAFRGACACATRQRSCEALSHTAVCYYERCSSTSYVPLPHPQIHRSPLACLAVYRRLSRQRRAEDRCVRPSTVSRAAHMHMLSPVCACVPSMLTCPPDLVVQLPAHPTPHPPPPLPARRLPPRIPHVAQSHAPLRR